MSATGVLAAQNTPSRPKFEAASVKPAERCSMENTIDDSRIALSGDPLNLVLMEAFNLKMDQMTARYMAGRRLHRDQRQTAGRRE